MCQLDVTLSEADRELETHPFCWTNDSRSPKTLYCKSLFIVTWLYKGVQQVYLTPVYKTFKRPSFAVYENTSDQPTVDAKDTF